MVILNIYLHYMVHALILTHQALEMATHEKQKKSRFINFYKFSSSSNNSYKPKPEPVIVATEPRKSLERQETVVAGRRSVEYNGGGGFVEARKSVSQVESNVVSAAAFLQVKVMVSDMPGFMQVHAFRCARRTYDSLEKFSSKHMAYNIKKEFDKVYGPAWHCIVGSNFGSFVTHSTGCFLYFSMEKLYILVFKTKVRKVLEY